MTDQLLNTEVYTNCKNCGKYTNNKTAINGIYCSTSCAVLYRYCINCGKYFAADKNKTNTCSQECAVIYKIKVAEHELYSNLKDA